MLARSTIEMDVFRRHHLTEQGRPARDNIEVYEIWAWYRREVEEATDARIPAGWWHYATFDDGAPIKKEMRVIYRERPDLQKAFPDPRSTGENSFRDWAQRETCLLYEPQEDAT